MFELAILRVIWARLREEVHLARHDESGYSVETVVIMAGLAVLALAVVGFIAAKVLAKAKSINLN